MKKLKSSERVNFGWEVMSEVQSQISQMIEIMTTNIIKINHNVITKKMNKNQS